MPEDNSPVTSTVSSTTSDPINPIPVNPEEAMNGSAPLTQGEGPISGIPSNSDYISQDSTYNQATIDPMSQPVPEPVPQSPVMDSLPNVPADEPTPTNDTPIDDSSQMREQPMPARNFELEPPSQTVIDVATKIGEAENILIALSGDPSVDELATAIGLSIYLDKLGKNATAIYSGTTPNALEFLNPDETFESSADALQDFVIALNKEKADHLRYKLDGDYVKVYITPYRSRISEDDLEFSYGDFNIDLVLALDVVNGVDLDAALREHGRIMHDAVVVNITTGNPGRFGEIEWSDKKASSVSEMIAHLLYSVQGEEPLGKEEATAFLTGIVAATNRFSNANTTPETMKIASRLMESGANQQLISKNITPDIDNEMFSLLNMPTTVKKDNDPTKLEVEHEGEEPIDGSNIRETDSKEVNATITEKESTLLDDLKAAEASLAQAGSETTPDLSNQPVRLDNEPVESVESLASEMKNISENDLESSNSVDESSYSPNPELPQVSKSFESSTTPAQNPAEALAPTVSSSPEINGVPDINFAAEPSEAVLPPAPAPPIDTDNTLTPDLDALKSLDSTVLPSSAPITSGDDDSKAADSYLGPQPAMQDQVYRPQASDPGAFKIPGM